MKIFDLVLFQTMGDVLMTTPIVSEIRKKYPGVYLRFHTNKCYGGLLARNSEIDEIVTYDNGSYTKLYQYLRGKQSDHIARMAMANHYDTMWHHTLETRNKHMIDWYAERTGLLDGPIQDKHIRFNVSDEARARVSKKLPKEPYAVIHTTSRVDSKDWPIAHFNTLIGMLKNLPLSKTIVQVGIPSDKKAKGVADLCGTTYEETAAIMEKASYYVGVDSGPSYIAEALNLPSFLIMGATMATPQESGQEGPFVGPIGPSVHYIEPVRPENENCKPVPCYTHCLLKKACNIGIMPEKVLEVIKEAIHAD